VAGGNACRNLREQRWTSGTLIQALVPPAPRALATPLSGGGALGVRWRFRSRSLRRRGPKSGRSYRPLRFPTFAIRSCLQKEMPQASYQPDSRQPSRKRWYFGNVRVWALADAPRSYASLQECTLMACSLHSLRAPSCEPAPAQLGRGRCLLLVESGMAAFGGGAPPAASALRLTAAQIDLNQRPVSGSPRPA
jgi:hypothetical protein